MSRIVCKKKALFLPVYPVISGFIATQKKVELLPVYQDKESTPFGVLFFGSVTQKNRAVNTALYSTE